MKDKVYDAIVVGSGATGGVAALALAQRGLKTLVLEAGPDLNGGEAYGSPVANLVRRLGRHWFTKSQEVQKWHGGYWETNPDLFVDDRENPYSTPEETPYLWIRGRQVGGRTHTWGGVCLRFSDFEFQAPERDGKGGRWPIAYEELAPFYGRVERILEVHGGRDRLPELPDGEFLEPGRLSSGELRMQDRIGKRFGRRLVISRGIRARRSADTGESYSRLSSNQTTLRLAKGTGNLSLRSGAVVCRIVVDSLSAAATGVEFIDAADGSLHRLSAGLVVLCASPIETIRLLLNSRSTAFPDGIGGGSGLLGSGVMDHIATMVYFYLPDLPEEAHELLGSEGAVIPRYANLRDPDREALGFSRGFGYWGGVSRLGFPRLLRRRPREALGFFCGMGEALTSEANRVTLDPDLKDRWGIPAARIRYAWLEEDLRLARRMRRDLVEMIEVAEGKTATLSEVLRRPLLGAFLSELDRKWEISVPGAFVHEVGGARMGVNPSRSVTNSFGQLWDCPNIVIGDGAVFPSSGWQNPTLTAMALCLRACENAADRLKRREI